MKIIIATQNQGKLKEFKEILQPLGYDVMSADEYGVNIDGIVETGTTFEENALIKVRYLYELTGVSVIADDSGLTIDALPDILGVYSARYMGYDTAYSERNEHILNLLENESNRDAAFHCVIALKDDSGEYVFAGKCEGLIDASIGNEGFGYDPIFYPVGYDQSFASMNSEEKNKISHRGLALNLLVDHLKGDH